MLLTLWCIKYQLEASVVDNNWIMKIFITSKIDAKVYSSKTSKIREAYWVMT